MTPPGIDLTFSEDARTRVRRQGYEEVHSFLASVPRTPQAQILARFPRISGFRAGAPQSDEQAKRLARRLTSSERQEPRDWEAFARLWYAWCVARVTASDLASRIIDSLRERESAEPALEGLLAELKRVASNAEVTREVLESAIIYSPLPTDIRLLSSIRSAPTRDSFDHRKRMDDLARRIAEAEARFADHARCLDLLKAVSEQLREAEARIELLEKYGTGSGGALEPVVDAGMQLQLNDLSREVGVTARELADLRERLTSASEHQSASLAPPTPVSLQDSQSDVVAVGAPKALLEAKPYLITFQREDTDLSAPGAASESDYRTALSEELFLSGLARVSAEQVALELVAGLIAGQQITLRGSLAHNLLVAIRRCVAGKWDVGTVPIGLADATSLGMWEREAEPDRNLVLVGVNNSAFEIYGNASRMALVAHQGALRSSQRIYLCTATEGPGALPLIPGFVDLGPIVDSDTLHWRPSGASARRDRAVCGDVAQFRQTFDPITLLGNAKEQLDSSVDLLPVHLSALGTLTITRAFAAVTALLPGDDFESRWSALFFGWIWPQLQAAGLGQKRLQGMVASGIFARALSDARGVRMLSTLPVESST